MATDQLDQVIAFTFWGDEIFVKGFDTFGSFDSSETAAAGSDEPTAKESSSI